MRRSQSFSKKAQLIELMHANMRGLSFAQIRLQEVIQYLDNMVRIAEVTRETISRRSMGRTSTSSADA